MEKIICCTEGVSRGNPGPAAVGVNITDVSGSVLHEIAQSIGNATVIYAAYHAVMVGLGTLETIFGSETHTLAIELCLTNETVKKQLNAEVAVTDPGLIPLFMAIHNLRVTSFPNLEFVQVATDKNKEACHLGEQALDGVR